MKGSSKRAAFFVWAKARILYVLHVRHMNVTANDNAPISIFCPSMNYPLPLASANGLNSTNYSGFSPTG